MSIRLIRLSPVFVGLALVVAIGLGASGQPAGPLATRRFAGSIEHPAIEYGSRPPTDAVAEINRKLKDGTIRPTFDASTGYLRALLTALDIQVESQVLVFTKTGIQQAITAPTNPRALLFNDSAVVGYIRGAPVLEIASHDPRQGVVFYTLSQAEAPAPVLEKRDRCLSCHESLSSLDVPGMLVRSHFTDPTGAPLRTLGTQVVDHRTPFDQRWGGWYVTGTHGSMRHLGNAVVTDPDHPLSMITSSTLNVKLLDGRFDPGGYLSAQSDIVALMVFEHQMHAINLLTRVGWDVRVAEYDGQADLARDPLRQAIVELVDYLLFIDEAPLTARVAGTSGFAETFVKRSVRDRRGRSLRELDLTTRLMRYRCSYMIYSAAFDGLPATTRDAVYRRIWQVLSGQAKDARYARLSAADRRAIIEILRDTKKGLPDYFREPGPEARLQ